jgi:transposase
MKKTMFGQEVFLMRFSEAHTGWQSGKLTQVEAAQLLGVSERTFRRQLASYERDGIEGLKDKRLGQVSHRRVAVDELTKTLTEYKTMHSGWNVRHFYWQYTEKLGGKRSYTWVKNSLQKAGAVTKRPAKGKHRLRREPSPIPGMMIHQDASTHEWVPGKKWDLVATMDDATNEQYSMFFVEQEGTASSFRGVGDVIKLKGLFSTFYSDRGSHYWNTPEAGGKVDKGNPTHFGVAMERLSITMIPAYSPEARGRSERMFETHQDRLVKELALHKITEMEAANLYIAKTYMPEFNLQFKRPAREKGSAFVKYAGPDLDDVLCEQYDRTVGKDNCVRFENLALQIPAVQYRFHFVKATVKVCKYTDGRMAIFHGPRKLAVYNLDGKEVRQTKRKAA